MNGYACKARLTTSGEWHKGVVSRATTRGLSVGLRTRKIAKIGEAMHVRTIQKILSDTKCKIRRKKHCKLAL